MHGKYMCVPAALFPFTHSHIHIHASTPTQTEEALKQREAAREIEERWQQKLMLESADARKEIKALGVAVEEEMGVNVAVIRCVLYDEFLSLCMHGVMWCRAFPLTIDRHPKC